MEGAIKTEKRWWEFPSGKLLVPKELAHTLVSQTHQATHRGHAACSQVNTASRVFRQKPPGIQLKGILPLEHLGVDFTEMKPHRHYRYLLVMVCTFLRWVKDFPTWTERASEVARCLLREIVKLHSAYRPRVLRWWNEPAGHLKRLSKCIRETDCS